MHQIVVFCLVNALLIGQAYSACQKSSLLNAKDSIGPAVGGTCINGYNCFAVNGGDYCFTMSPTCPPSSTAINTAVIGPAIGGVCALGTCYLANGSENCYACVDNTVR
ncbi:unnamed protein product, partial [Mesorhabditis belari]|uniref:Uncharacterized protein n=1 Tax=Mesorhabditis belari TaxID=2138241 RepID=A0AAF3F0V7_9BILA